MEPGDIVLNMFGGAGPYSIQAARRTPCTVYNIDVNPEATTLCARNAGLNRLAGEVVAITGDAMESRDLVQCECDRTIMPLPERSAEFAAAAVRATKDGGIIHYYSHIHADSKRDAAGLAGIEAAGILPCRTEVLHTRLVRAVGPRYYQTVADVRHIKSDLRVGDGCRRVPGGGHRVPYPGYHAQQGAHDHQHGELHHDGTPLREHQEVRVCKENRLCTAQRSGFRRSCARPSLHTPNLDI